MTPSIQHLFCCPAHRLATAELIHHTFWRGVPGASAEAMAERLAQADRADRVPLCLVALQGPQLLGVVNLVHNDAEQHPDWSPWLAGVVVAEPWRGQGVGSALVRALLQQAQALAVAQVFLGTDGPGFYTRLGAVLHQQVRPDFCYLRFDLAPPGS